MRRRWRVIQEVPDCKSNCVGRVVSRRSNLPIFGEAVYYLEVYNPNSYSIKRKRIGSGGFTPCFDSSPAYYGIAINSLKFGEGELEAQITRSFGSDPVGASIIFVSRKKFPLQK